MFNEKRKKSYLNDPERFLMDAGEDGLALIPSPEGVLGEAGETDVKGGVLSSVLVNFRGGNSFLSRRSRFSGSRFLGRGFFSVGVEGSFLVEGFAWSCPALSAYPFFSAWSSS